MLKYLQSLFALFRERTALFSVFMFIFASLFCYGCLDSGTGTSCNSDSDCFSGENCVNKICVQDVGDLSDSHSEELCGEDCPDARDTIEDTPDTVDIVDTFDNLPDEELELECVDIDGCCNPGESQECGVTDIGLCELGIQYCDERSVWGNCIGFTTPESEICDGLDNDCDGDMDNGFDFESDRFHCGSCNHECGEYEICDGSQCTASMVSISGGIFMMGCNSSADNYCWFDDRELPYHNVNVSEFEIDLTEVTQGQYRVCVYESSCSEPVVDRDQCNWNYSDREDYPVNCIDWYQAKAYCEWSGKRLCSEAEWEKAARGTDERIYPWGNEIATCDRAVMRNVADVFGCGAERTWPVGSKPAGIYGLLDMSGNVWEWVEDDYHNNYDDAPDDGSAWINSPRGPEQVYRGGSFNTAAIGLRASHRHHGISSHNYDGLGVRCCNDGS